MFLMETKKYQMRKQIKYTRINKGALKNVTVSKRI